MNILFLTKYQLDTGGIAEVMQALSTRFDERGHNVVMYTPHDSAKSGKTINRTNMCRI